MFQTLRLLPARVGIIEGEVFGVTLFLLGGIFWMLVPFLDTPTSSGWRSRFFTGLGVGLVFYIVAMTVWGYLT
jgi:quinol-cytochrome oxidoreductase complex cytochrome b subunit